MMSNLQRNFWSVGRTGFALVLLGALCWFCSCSSTKKSPEDAAPPSPEKRAFITGCALLADANPGGHLGILVYLAGTSYNAHTDENGLYTMADLPAGSYTIVAERQGYQTVTVDRVELDPTLHTRERPYVARTAILELSLIHI
ncbi:MAG: carboxypeptidase-like regulatory domain-containing protein, partial [Candidatus Sumerlaeaceae bacterium]|nr:carboxypeptidase-like regulatory domain-containing protein [Candidatus Sumerlaeaceae bacterium]